MWDILSAIAGFFWQYIGFAVVIIVGLYFTFISKAFQLRIFGKLYSTFRELGHTGNKHDQGVGAFRLYCVSIGGMVGLGNIAAVCLAVSVGGPGSLFWLWVASLFGMIVKYAEIYLGVTHRVRKKRGYDGGPMYYLAHAFSKYPFWGKFLPTLFCILMCIYGVEIYQFSTIAHNISDTWSLNHNMVILFLLLLVVYCAYGGIKRLATICVVLMPIFFVIYVGVCLFILLSHYGQLADLFFDIIKSAFIGHAPLGGFVGSSFLVAAQTGTANAIYSGDICIGYDSITQSETNLKHPERQAKIAVFSLFTDTLICTLSCLTVLVTGVWSSESLGIQSSDYIRYAFQQYIPYADIFLSILFFLAGFTTIAGYLVVGLKCAKWLNEKIGQYIYMLCAICSYVVFAFVPQDNAFIVMSIVSGGLMVINLTGIIKLRREIQFK